MPEEQADKVPFNPFDLTKVPHYYFIYNIVTFIVIVIFVFEAPKIFQCLTYIK